MKSKELLGMNIIITLKVMKAKKLIASQKVETYGSGYGQFMDNTKGPLGLLNMYQVQTYILYFSLFKQYF